MTDKWSVLVTGCGKCKYGTPPGTAFQGQGGEDLKKLLLDEISSVVRVKVVYGRQMFMGYCLEAARWAWASGIGMPWSEDDLECLDA